MGRRLRVSSLVGALTQMAIEQWAIRIVSHIHARLCSPLHMHGSKASSAPCSGIATMSAPISFEIVFGLFLFAVVFVPLEHLFPIRRQKPLRSGWKVDLVYYVVGCFVGHLSDAISMGAMLWLRQKAGLSFQSAAAGQPAWLQFSEILVMADFLAYLFHRSLHRNPCLWRFHRVHHSSRRMDWLANVHLHPVDKLMGDCFQFVPIFCVGFATAPLLAYTIFLGFQGFLNHSNIRVNYGPFRWIIASPQFHHWHHCNHPEAYNKNFAPHLVIFDLLFGTAYIPPAHVMPTLYGVPDPVPDSFSGQMMYPFVGGPGTVIDGPRPLERMWKRGPSRKR